jgi:putative tryptophan/tyrosine transport system substrate-binding protein
MFRMKRRDFITLFGGVAATWPFAARAQQQDRVRRIGVLMSLAENDEDGQARLASFIARLNELGWSEGRNAHFEVRWAAGNAERYRSYARELAKLAPDVILAQTSSSVAALQQAAALVPIIFVNVIDPVGAGFVDSLAHPGGDATGFVAIEYAVSAKWLELLKEIAPHITRVAVLRDPSYAAGIGQFAAIQAVGPLGIELSALDERDAETIGRAVATFANGSNCGLVVTAGPFVANHPDVIARLALRYKLPAVYPFKPFVLAGGLASYGPDTAKQFRPAAEYVHRILHGEKPADLPVQAPTKYELVINLKTAKSLGIEVPPTLLARADEVIE